MFNCFQVLPESHCDSVFLWLLFFLCTASLQFIRDEKNSITLLGILYCDQGLTPLVISNLQMKLRTK